MLWWSLWRLHQKGILSQLASWVVAEIWICSLLTLHQKGCVTGISEGESLRSQHWFCFASSLLAAICQYEATAWRILQENDVPRLERNAMVFAERAVSVEYEMKCFDVDRKVDKSKIWLFFDRLDHLINAADEVQFQILKAWSCYLLKACYVKRYCWSGN